MKFFLSFCLLFFTFASFAQTDLLTYEQPLPCLNKKFTIVANVVEDQFGNWNITEDEIRENVAAMNEHFANICVSFEVCEFRSVKNYQLDTLDSDLGDYEQLVVEEHQANRINFYFVSEIAGADPLVCGFANLGGIGVLDRDGIVIKKGNCANPTTFAHEMGHYFGLQHTFEGSGEEHANGDNCETTGDQICDTPADNFVVGQPMSSYVDGDCRYINTERDENGDYYRPDVGNIMSYYPCACGFTTGQFLKMAEVCRATNGRMW
ncbi:MAG TPA: hypothetical protein ENJ95_05745 [Bacteroidetes bacterium]|nr:hypothetical protein [Bacteroidota bacterium]